MSDTKKKLKMPKNLPFLVVILMLPAILLLIYFFVFSNENDVDEENVNTAIEKYKEELPDLKRNARNNPEDTQALRDYAVALYATGDTQEAKKFYEKELALNENDAQLLNNLGNVYRDLEEYDSAVDTYKKALKIDPKATNTYHNLCNLLVYTLDRVEEAIEIYYEAIDAIPEKEVDFLNSIGLAYEQLEQTENAIDAYEKVLQLESENVTAQNALERLK